MKEREHPLQPKTAMDVAQELVSQPALFLEFDGVRGLEVPAKALPEYNGKRSTLDERKLLYVGALRLLGASDRQIEEAAHVTRRTIPVLLAELEKSGRITPLKERLARATGDNAERANIALRALLDRASDGAGDIDLAAMIKAVSTAAGIATEKYLLLTGQATEIVEQRTGAGREEFETWWKSQVVPVQASASPATDLDSAGTPHETEGITQADPPRDGSDTPPSAQDPDAKGGGGGPGSAAGPDGRTG